MSNVQIFATDESGHRREITDLYWFEENGVHDLGGEGHFERYAIEVVTERATKQRLEACLVALRKISELWEATYGPDPGLLAEIAQNALFEDSVAELAEKNRHPLEIFGQGWNDYFSKIPFTLNPYEIGTAGHAAWACGWREAKKP